jgi:hypothetical protein
MIAAPSDLTMSHEPYSDPAANRIYALLFCDEPELFVNLGEHWPALFANPADEIALAAIAADESLEGRVRALAYGRLRNLGKPVAPHILLGAVIEVGLDTGLDALAAYCDGGVRYINATGKTSIVEGPAHALAAETRALLAASQNVVNQIGPSDKARLPPPAAGEARMSFIVSDGLSFGEGKFEDLARDRMGGPVLQAATRLLIAISSLTTGP